MHEIEFNAYGRCAITDKWPINNKKLVVNRIHYVHKPSAQYVCNGITTTMKEGYLYLFPYSAKVVWSNDSCNPFDHTYFNFVINAPLAKDDVYEFDLSDNAPARAVIAAVDALCAEYGRNTDGMEDVVARYLENLLWLLDKIQPVFATADKRILDVLNFIHENYTEKIHIDTLAGIACMEKTYFIKFFGESMKMPPYKYIKKLRASYGISLIRSGVSVTEAATLCGYGSVSSFSNMMKKSTGLYPSEIS